MSRIVRMRNADSDTVIATSVTVADTSLRRAVGLLGRRSLMENEGLWIIPSSGIHTFGMGFAIDIIGLDRQHRVVRLWHAVKPNRLTAVNFSVRSVVELAAGTIHACAIRMGDQLQLE